MHNCSYNHWVCLREEITGNHISSQQILIQCWDMNPIRLSYISYIPTNLSSIAINHMNPIEFPLKSQYISRNHVLYPLYPVSRQDPLKRQQSSRSVEISRRRASDGCHGQAKANGAGAGTSRPLEGIWSGQKWREKHGKKKPWFHLQTWGG